MRVAIVNDTIFAAEALRRAVLGGGQHEVAWIAHSGADAIARCATDRPDVVLMDLLMPGLNGVETTRRIMAATPCAIIVVTGNINEQPGLVFEAMGAGALDAVDAPVLNATGGFDGVAALLRKLDTAAKLISRPQHSAARSRPHNDTLLIAIGASAGGPAAIARVLGALPRDCPAALVVVQHVDPQFAAGLAAWLNHSSPLPVRLAAEGDAPTPGTVLVAGREEHLVFTSANRLGYTRAPAESSYRPSVDVFFKSLTHFWKGDAVGVLLTGMGRDGAEGLRLMKTSGHLTLAQDQQTSAVYGMPKAAADLRAATEILALDKIGLRLANIVTEAKRT